MGKGECRENVTDLKKTTAMCKPCMVLHLNVPTVRTFFVVGKNQGI